MGEVNEGGLSFSEAQMADDERAWILTRLVRRARRDQKLKDVERIQGKEAGASEAMVETHTLLDKVWDMFTASDGSEDPETATGFWEHVNVYSLPGTQEEVWVEGRVPVDLARPDPTVVHVCPGCHNRSPKPLDPNVTWECDCGEKMEPTDAAPTETEGEERGLLERALRRLQGVPIGQGPHAPAEIPYEEAVALRRFLIDRLRTARTISDEDLEGRIARYLASADLGPMPFGGSHAERAREVKVQASTTPYPEQAADIVGIVRGEHHLTFPSYPGGKITCSCGWESDKVVLPEAADVIGGQVVRHMLEVKGVGGDE